jgi:glycopeptide antibiotics resistance protein
VTGTLVRPVATPAREHLRVRLIALFVVYLALLTEVVLWKLEAPYVGEGALRQVKLVPFAPGDGFGASAPFEVVANVVLFVPFGLYLGLIAASWPWWKLTGIVAMASLALEVAQYILAVGSSDVTDVVANGAGGLAGLGILALARRRLRARTALVTVRVCFMGTVFALLAIAIFVASPLRYTPPQDVDAALHWSSFERISSDVCLP